MTDKELMQDVLDTMEAAIKAGDWKVDGACDPDYVLETIRARLAQPEPREIKIEFKEWIHPHMGLVPVDPKTPLILKAVIREEV